MKKILLIVGVSLLSPSSALASYEERADKVCAAHQEEFQTALTYLYQAEMDSEKRAAYQWMSEIVRHSVKRLRSLPHPTGAGERFTISMSKLANNYQQMAKAVGKTQRMREINRKLSYRLERSTHLSNRAGFKVCG